MIWIAIASAFISGLLFGLTTPTLIKGYIRWRAKRAAKRAGKHWSTVLDKVDTVKAARKSVTWEGPPTSEDFPIETLTAEELREYEKKMAQREKKGESFVKDWCHPKPNQWIPSDEKMEKK